MPVFGLVSNSGMDGSGRLLVQKQNCPWPCKLSDPSDMGKSSEGQLNKDVPVLQFFSCVFLCHMYPTVVVFGPSAESVSNLAALIEKGACQEQAGHDLSLSKGQSSGVIYHVGGVTQA